MSLILFTHDVRVSYLNLLPTLTRLHLYGSGHLDGLHTIFNYYVKSDA